MRRFERHVGASSITFMRPRWSPSFPRGYPGRLLHPEYRKAPARTRSAGGRVLASSEIEVRAIRLSPSGAELAGLKLQRFRSSLRFLGMLLSPLAFAERRAGVPGISLKFGSGNLLVNGVPMLLPLQLFLQERWEIFF